MDEVVDPFEVAEETLEKRAEETEERKLASVRLQGREAAIKTGRRYGEDEARLRGETGIGREQRIARAMSYAAWEFDGKPIGNSEAYEREFGVRTSTISGVSRGGADPKNGKKG